MDLKSLAVKYGCDKLYHHSYVPFYEKLFAVMRVRKLLEIGIGYEELMRGLAPKYVHGGSLMMWRDYFPDALIYGCDVRKDTLFEAESIVTFFCDQSRKDDLYKMMAKVGTVDVVIDDGSHKMEDQVETFKVLKPFVSSPGVYVVEDVMEPEKVAEKIGGVVHRFLKGVDDNLVVVRI
jgi:limonene-1,2-epoxide hydrolase